MKTNYYRFIFFFIFTLFLSPKLFADQYRSFQNGVWTATTTWEKSVNGGSYGTTTTVPGNQETDTVLIRNGHTVEINTNPTITELVVGEGSSGTLKTRDTANTFAPIVKKNITINSNATFTVSNSGNRSHILTIGGNLTNNGTLDFIVGATKCDVTFNNVGNQTVSGTGGQTDFNLITVNMGTSSSNILEISSSNFSAATGFLTLSNGTIKFSGSYSLSQQIFPSGATTISSTQGIWLNNSNVNVTAQNFTTTVSGVFRVSAGTYNIGTASGNSLLYNSGSIITIEGGILNIAGRLARVTGTNSTTTYTQSGGTVTVVTSGSVDATRAGFDIGASGSSFTMSDGSIVIEDSTSNAYDYYNVAGTSSVTGGTIQFGNTSTTNAQIFRVSSSVSLHNLTVFTNGQTTKPTLKLLSGLTLFGNLNIQSGTTINANGNNISLEGNWSNSGTFTPSTGLVTFYSSSSQTITGATTFNRLKIDNPSGVSMLSNVTVGDTLILWSGTFSVGGNLLTLNGPPISTTPNNLSTTSSSNLSFGGSSSGVTIPSSVVNLGKLTINKSSNGVSLSSNITLYDTLTLTSGTFSIGSNTLVLSDVILSGTPTNLSTTSSSRLSYTGTAYSFTLPSSVSSLKTFIVDNVNGVSLNGDLTIQDTLNLNLGQLTVGTRTLTLNGRTVSVLSTNLLATASSSLVFGGSATNVSLLGGITSLNNLTVNNSNGLAVVGDLSVNGTLSLVSGKIYMGLNTLTLNLNGSVSRTNGYVVGKFKKSFSADSVSHSFEIGDSTNYTPSSVTFQSVTNPGTLTASVVNSEHPSLGLSGIISTKSANRYWTLSNSGIVFSTYSTILNFVSSDVDGGADPGSFNIEKYDPPFSLWSTTSTGVRTSTSIEAIGLTSFSDYATGENGAPQFSVSPTSKNFGNVADSTSKIDSVTVTNNGSAALTISSITSDNARFSVSPTSGVVSVSSSKKFYITFSPTDTGTVSGTITFNHNASGSPQTVSVEGRGVTSSFSISTSSLSFGSVRKNVAKLDSLTITNAGSDTLKITSISSNSGQFVVSPSSAENILQDSSKKYYITFTPTSTGAQSGIVTFTHNAAGSPSTVSLTGTGVEPTFSLSRTSIDFGSTQINSPVLDSFYVRNTGTYNLTVTSANLNSGQYSLDTASAVIAPSDSQKFIVTFNPSSAGTKNATIIFTHDATGSPDTVSLTGIAATPIFSASPTSLTFDDLLVSGGGATKNIVVSNTGNANLIISSVTSGNSEFSVSPTSATLLPNATRTFTVTFDATSEGSKGGNITFSHNATGSPANIPVSGTGIAPHFSSSAASVNYSNLLVNTTKEDSVIITNNGTSDLLISSVLSNNAKFTVSPSSVTIPKTESRKFTIIFAPTDTGAQSGTLTFSHSASVSTFSVSLSGRGVKPIISLSSNSRNFGNVILGQSKNDSVIVTNVGTSNMTISSVSSDNARFSVSPSSVTLISGATQKFTITYTPTTMGSTSGTLSISHDAEGTPHTVSMSGVGIAPLFSPSTTNVSMGSVFVNTTKSDTSIIITNTGTSIMSITSVLSDNSQFSVSPTTATIAVSATKKFTVYFTPTSIGLKTGEIIFNHDATGSPDTIIVSGTGVLPSFSSSPSSLAFGNVVINTPKVDSITVTNNGGATMLIDSIVSVNSVDYGISQSSAVIGAFSSKKFYITFTPLSAGSKPNTFTFYHNGSPSSNQITVSGFCIQPLFSPSPTTLSFGGIIILDSTKTDSITVSNTGNSTLSISNITSSNNTDFSISPTSGSVSPSESKKFGVTFHPSTVGLKTGSIIFTHDAAGSPDTVIVNGQGDRRVFTLSATSKSYGDVLTGQPKVDSVIVTNDGTVSMTVSSVTSSRATFTVNPTSAIITAGSSKSFHITFSPVDSGTVYGIIIFNHNAPTNPDTVSVSGRGIAPIAQFSTASISFGNVAVNTTKKDSVTVTNSGGAPLIIEAVSSSREKFTVTPIDAVMQPLESKKFYVTFAPTDTGENTGNIVFTHNASGSPTNVAVDGHAIAPFFTSTPDSLDFGDVSVNSSHEDTITVWNTGSDLLSINSVTTDDGQFTVSSDKEDVAPGDSVQFIITFQPLLPIGIKRANVIFAHNALALPTKIPVKGNAIYPIFSADTNFLNFDTVYLHTPKTLDVVVTNIGSSPLTIFEINPIQTGHPISEFSTDFSSERVIETASGITVQVTFDPSGIGLSTAKLLFSHNGSLRPDTVRLSALTVDTSRYRSFDATLLALDRDNKGGLGRAVLAKADRALFKYTIKNTLLNAKILIVEFNAVIDTVGGSKVTSVPPADSAIAFKPKPDAKVTNLKRWTLYYPTPIDTGATVEITAVGKKASLIKVKKHSWSSDPLTNLGKKTAVSLVSNVLGLPRPNRINVLKRAFDGGGFNSTVGLLVGLNRQIDSPAYYGWVLIDNEKQTLVSLGNKAGKLHTKVPRGFDKLDVGKGNNPFIGPKGILLNRFHDNRLFANMVALKLNIVASAMGVNPVGFGELKYDDGTNNPLVNGKTIAHISRMADTMMSGYYVFDSTANARVHKFADTSVFKILDSAVYKINNSFEGVIDTISFSSGLRLKGTRSISEVPYLIPSGLKPTIITPLENNWVLPSSPVLEQNYPNPFNPRTTIQFYLLEPSVITLKVYNILGQEVATLFDNEEVLDGYTDVEFDASSLSSGVYFYRLTLNDGSFTKMKKLMLIK